MLQYGKTILYGIIPNTLPYGNIIFRMPNSWRSLLAQTQSARKQRQYVDYGWDFIRIVKAYVHRGHIDARQEDALYSNGAMHAKNGYILSKDSSFISNTNEAYEEWLTHMEPFTDEVEHLVGTRGGPRWDPVDDDYHRQAYEEILAEQAEGLITQPSDTSENEIKTPYQPPWLSRFI